MAPRIVRGYTIDDLVYDSVTHTSTFPDGRAVPHVTTVLAATGLTTDFEQLGAAVRGLSGRIEAARDRGSVVHQDCHAHDDDDLVWDSVDTRVAPYVRAWQRCRKDKGLVPVAHARERRVYHQLYGYTGILDGIFHYRAAGAIESSFVLVDLKVGDPEAAAAHLQTAAYEGAWTAQHPDQPIVERWAVWLRPDRRVPYIVVNHSAHAEARSDFPTFLAALATYNAQPGRRRKRS